MSAGAGRPPRRVLIVDGYNVINARRDARVGDLSHARDALLNELIDYAGWSGQQIILVFDAWMSDRASRTEEKHGAVTVVYTRKGEIADHYIERLCDGFAQDIEDRRVELRVATSDALEQTVVLGRGASRVSARELMYEMQAIRADGIRHTASARPTVFRSAIRDRLPADVRRRLEEMKKGGRDS